MKHSTSWEKEAGWYSEHLSGADTFHAKVILPNLTRLTALIKGETVLDLACGNGFFTKSFIESGAKVIGVDISASLIAEAKKAVPNATFYVASAHDLSNIQSNFVDKIVCVLAIQNIQEVKETFAECKRVLKSGGKLFLVLNHPAFRIPKASSWEWDANNKQYRRIDSYLSEKKIEIDMHPGKSKKSSTVSFHRSLQYYFKLLGAEGFTVTKLEEWISHRKSEAGPRQKEEDRMRKEIPLFLFLEGTKE